jgi:hypothetical protein
MGKFLKFQVRNAATATSATGSRDILINVDQIASVSVGRANQPIEELFMTMEIEEVPKKEITEKYGYIYP